MELVRKLNGVEFYNDSKATNVDATMKAVASFAGGIHLILGGKDKDSDYGSMAELLKERVKAVYTIGSAAEKIERQLHGVVKMVAAETMQIAVARRRRLLLPAMWCCCRRRARASTSLRTMSIGARCFGRL